MKYHGTVAANFIPVTLLLPSAAGQWSRSADQDRAEAALLALYAARTAGCNDA